MHKYIEENLPYQITFAMPIYNAIFGKNFFIGMITHKRTQIASMSLDDEDGNPESMNQLSDVWSIGKNGDLP